MVPSDPKNSLFPDRHARPKRGIRKRRGVSPLLPAAGFARPRIDALVRARKPLPIEARLSMRPFVLRRRGLALRPVPAVGSILPAYIFETILKAVADPFGPVLPIPSGFFMASRERSTPDTRCQRQLKGFPSVFEPPLPSRTSRSFGIVALNPTPAGNACPYELPDLPSLPASLK